LGAFRFTLPDSIEKVPLENLIIAARLKLFPPLLLLRRTIPSQPRRQYIHPKFLRRLLLKTWLHIKTIIFVKIAVS
jgi:hypothetical protein